MVTRDEGLRSWLVNPYDAADAVDGPAAFGITVGTVLASTAGLVVLAAGSAAADPVFDADDVDYGFGPSSEPFTYDGATQPDLFGGDSLYGGSAPDAVTFEVAETDPLPAPTDFAVEPVASEPLSTPVVADVVTPTAPPEPDPVVATNSATSSADAGEMTFDVTDLPATEILGPDRAPVGTGAFENSPDPGPDPEVPTLPDRGNESAPLPAPLTPPVGLVVSTPPRPGVLVASADLEGLRGLDMGVPPTGADMTGSSNEPVLVAAEPAPPIRFGVTDNPAADILRPDPVAPGQGRFSPSPVLDEPAAVEQQPRPTFGVTPSPIPDLVPGATPPDEPPASNGEPVNFGTTPMSPEFMRDLKVTNDEPTFGVTNPGTAAAITTGRPIVPGGAFSRDPRLTDPTNTSPGQQSPPPVQPSTPGGSPVGPAGMPQAPRPGSDSSSAAQPTAPGGMVAPGQQGVTDPAAPRPPAQEPVTPPEKSPETNILGLPTVPEAAYPFLYSAGGIGPYSVLNAATILDKQKKLGQPISYGAAFRAGIPSLGGGALRDVLLANKSPLFGEDQPVLNWLGNGAIGSLVAVKSQDLAKSLNPAFNRFLEDKGIRSATDIQWGLHSELSDRTYILANFAGAPINWGVGEVLKNTGLKERFPYEAGMAQGAITSCLAVAAPVALQIKKWLWEACLAPAGQATIGYVATTPGEKAPLLDALLETCGDEELLYGVAKQIACESQQASTPPAPPGQATPSVSPVSFTPAPPSLSGLGLVGPGLVGPAIVGPRVVGPRVVGPRLVGPGLVGPGLVGPAIVGPRLVGPRSSGDAEGTSAGDSVGSAPQPSPALTQSMPPAQPSLVDQAVGWVKDRGAEANAAARTMIVGSEALDGTLGFGVTKYRVKFFDGGSGTYDPEGNLLGVERGNPPNKVAGWQLFSPLKGAEKFIPAAAGVAPLLVPIVP